MHSYFYQFGSIPRFRGCWLGFGAPIWLTYLIMFVSIALAVTIVVLLALNLAKRRSLNKSDSEALRILDTRYASGEIDRETYETIKKDLR
ncbi:MAG: SHOCT domain-containing protein [Sphaerochaetaceae bacterium]